MEILINKLPEDWQALFKEAFSKPYAKKLFAYLTAQIAQGKTIYPEKKDWFKAFEITPLSSVKCVIIGQDPYHGENQANGLAFSVNSATKIPPSLKNIYKEIQQTFNGASPKHGDLTYWSKQGVLLINAALTVEADKPGSHLQKGWLEFTQNIIAKLNSQPEGIVFLSWGAFAHSLTKAINLNKHCVIKTTHPSPLGANRASRAAPAFIGSQCFQLANKWLIEQNQTPIDWQIDNDY